MVVGLGFGWIIDGKNGAGVGAFIGFCIGATIAYIFSIFYEERYAIFGIGKQSWDTGLFLLCQLTLTRHKLFVINAFRNEKE